jgi:hypothetical protein
MSHYEEDRYHILRSLINEAVDYNEEFDLDFEEGVYETLFIIQQFFAGNDEELKKLAGRE